MKYNTKIYFFNKYYFFKVPNSNNYNHKYIFEYVHFSFNNFNIEKHFII